MGLLSIWTCRSLHTYTLPVLLLGLLFSQFIVLLYFNLVDFDFFILLLFLWCLFIYNERQKNVVSNKMRELTREEPYSEYILWKKIYFQQKKEEKRIKQKLFILNEFGITEKYSNNWPKEKEYWASGFFDQNYLLIYFQSFIIYRKQNKTMLGNIQRATSKLPLTLKAKWIPKYPKKDTSTFKFWEYKVTYNHSNTLLNSQT